MHLKDFVAGGGDIKSNLTHDKAGVLADGVSCSIHLNLTRLLNSHSHRTVRVMSRDLARSWRPSYTSVALLTTVSQETPARLVR